MSEIDADKAAAEAVTAAEKFEKLPQEKQLEVITLAESIAGQNFGEIQVTQEEKDVYYDKVSKALSYLPVSEPNADPNKLRLGTIGPIDITLLPDVKIHLNDAQVPAYEVDDGEDSFDRVGLKAAGYKIKRSFIDSSVYNFTGLMDYLGQRADDLGWYSVMTDNLIDEFHKELPPK